MGNILVIQLYCPLNNNQPVVKLLGFMPNNCITDIMNSSDKILNGQLLR